MLKTMEHKYAGDMNIKEELNKSLQLEVDCTKEELNKLIKEAEHASYKLTSQLEHWSDKEI